MTEHPFIPVIIGTNINAYTMARSFHEEYGVKPIIVGRASLPFTEYSTIMHAYEYEADLHNPKTFVTFLNMVARKYASLEKKYILIGTDDLYVQLIIENKEMLREHYLFNYIDEELMEQVYIKKNFYNLCREHGIDIPSTYYHSCASDEEFSEEVMFPVIIKPSDGVQYYRNPFEGLQKIYKVNSYEEINEVIRLVKTGGYQEDLIIQDFIPGDDTYMWDSVYYADQDGKGQLISFAQVALQEHAMTAIGNYTALLTRYNEQMMTKLARFLEAIGYVGFANFDLKYDERDGKFKVFEVNIRQGRSSYYVNACGYSMAKLFVDDLIYREKKELAYVKEPMLFSVVPKYVLRKYVQDEKLVQEMNRLIKHGKYIDPLDYKADNLLKRKWYLFMRQLNYVKKYRNSSWK